MPKEELNNNEKIDEAGKYLKIGEMAQNICMYLQSDEQIPSEKTKKSIEYAIKYLEKTKTKPEHQRGLTRIIRNTKKLGNKKEMTKTQIDELKLFYNTTLKACANGLDSIHFTIE